MKAPSDQRPPSAPSLGPNHLISLLMLLQVCFFLFRDHGLQFAFSPAPTERKKIQFNLKVPIRFNFSCFQGEFASLGQPFQLAFSVQHQHQLSNNFAFSVQTQLSELQCEIPSKWRLTGVSDPNSSAPVTYLSTAPP